MGRDKALLPFRGGTLVEHLAGLAGEVSAPVALIGVPERYAGLGLEALGERYAGCGPLSGIEAALSLERAEWNLILACDAVGVTRATLEALVAAAEEEKKAAVVAVLGADQRVNPLCAVWNTRAAGAVRAALEAGRYRVQEVAREAGLVVVEAGAGVQNINTPEDWAAAGDGR
jgi:molybdenum cofactor guanylyltransferase